MNKSEILSVFQDVVKKPRNSYIERYISNGGKAIGYYCTLIPAEIFTAAGMLPLRIRGAGSKSTALADTYVSSNICTFVRHSVNLALEGEYDFLNGLVCMNGCDQARRAYETWKLKTSIPFIEFISVPKTPEPRVIGFYISELERLIKAIEVHFAVKIGPQELQQAIKLHNSVRTNLIKLNNLRKGKNPPLTGTEALTITVAAHLMPLGDFNALIEQLLRETAGEQETRKYRARFIVSGGELDEPDFVKLIEDQGGMVVYEDTCFGARHYEDLVSEDGDPLTQIAERYFYKVPCGRMVNSFAPRYKNIEQIMKDYQADGIISQRIMHCIVNANHAYHFSRRSKTTEIPTLVLDREYLGGSQGQMKTRVQAFIENIESKGGLK